ncbi:MAG TPA: DUF6398 domain-containing protein [Chitinophagaceae bacterium]|nr:DUF6398 domain-containing protein [Chitinophagaceae bacterium]
MDKQKIQERQQQILDLIRDFCSKKLDEKYFQLAERLTQKLARKRNVPFVTGQIEVWAVAIIHALGTINFLFDKASTPYASVDEINKYFGTNKTTTGNKSKQIRDLLKLDKWDNEFSTKRMSDSNPFANLVMVDGLIVPLETLPEQYQIAVRQTRAEGKDISFTTR